ncbi:glycerophosphoryl diester phosphodiesterase [Pseudozyma hubeiensis SY62]|uniref:Glycerophosphoryl diester phosphodiesterase n=1 Tax=Pseudozyma hubeiensis (strain SY62) TaxID=1305764 RepID=R9PHE2_PSEHS|nr:glycerophosphoryl diester phosphodiesterase [Pseudozyma hubeiensis SY62]GAC97520.1 glycerophosphoryl diester phosphodiesterase [Pseudozyma hubeiensis SY62]
MHSLGSLRSVRHESHIAVMHVECKQRRWKDSNAALRRCVALSSQTLVAGEMSRSWYCMILICILRHLQADVERPMEAAAKLRLQRRRAWHRRAAPPFGITF